MYVPSSTRTRQSPKPTSKWESGRPYRHRRVNKLINMAPQPIQHCCIMNGLLRSRLNKDSCSTAPREVSPTADTRCTKPNNHSPTAGGGTAKELAVLFTAAVAIMVFAICSSRQHITVAAATPTTKRYCNVV